MELQKRNVRVIWGIQKFKYETCSLQFYLITDHKASENIRFKPNL